MKKLLLFLFFTVAISAQKPEIPKLSFWATDLTGTLSQDQTASLNSKLQAYSDTTSNQVVFLMKETLDGYPLEDYSYDVAKENNIGTKKNNNGILLLVVKNDHKLRIEVGYGLEGVFPDALSSSIIRNVIKPYFLRDDFYSGVNAGLDAIFSAIAGEYKADNNQRAKGRQFAPFSTIIGIIIFILFSFLRRRRGGKGGGFMYFGGLGGFGGGGSGGGFGGGGGFSGGGGSFGGGGSSGSW